MLTARQWRQLWYLPVLAIALALMMLRIMIMARLFGLTEFAQYNTGLLLSTTFGMLGCLGLQSLLQRDMPMHHARHRERAGLVLMVQAMLIACGCAAVLVLPAAALAGVAQLPATVAMVAVVHGLSQQLFLVVTVESRSRGEPLRYAMQNLVRAIAVVAAGGVVAAATGSAGWVLAAEAGVSLLMVAATLRGIERRTGWALSPLLQLAHRTWRRIAWPTAGVMLAISAASFVLLNVDRWAAATWLSPEAFAQFAFAGVLVLVAQAAQGMINASVYPMLARRFALSGTPAAFRLCSRVSLAVLVAGVALAWPAHAAAAAAIDRWFPAYQPAIALLGLLIAAALLRVSDFWSSFLMICGHERRLLRINLGAGAVGSMVWLAYESATGGLEPSALAFCRLTLMLAAAGHIASATLAAALRSRGATTIFDNSSAHAQSQ